MANKYSTEMKESLLYLAHEATEDRKERTYKKYTRRPQPAMPGCDDPNWTYEKWIDEEFEHAFAHPKKSLLRRILG